MTEAIDLVASILEANFWDESDFAGADIYQRHKFFEVAREIIDALTVSSKDHS